MRASHMPKSSGIDTDCELEMALASGRLGDIVIPLCPELLVALRKEMGKADLEPQVTADIPGRADDRKLLAAFLTRNAIRINSPVLYGMDTDLVYTCGLFYHVGIPILMQGVKGYSGTLAEALARQDRSFTDTENAAHRTDHAVVGALVARTWRLPSAIYQAVRLRHDFTVLRASSVPPEVGTLVAMAHLADHLVAQHEGVAQGKEWNQYGLECLAYLRVTEIEVDAWVNALQPVLEGVTL